MFGIKVVTRDQAHASGRQVPGCETHAFISGAGDPLHLRQHSLAPRARLPVAGTPSDRAGYVLEGEVRLGRLVLARGSSFVVERGASAIVAAGRVGATIVEFHDAANVACLPERRGGRVHAMPCDSVPRIHDLGSDSGVGGAIHADAACPTCAVWLHESDFQTEMRGVVPLQAHAADELIFVTAGSIRLGARVYGAGTAIAVGADTLYAFDVPAGGLSFLNFHVGPPVATTQAGLVRTDEAELWSLRVGRPRPIELAYDESSESDTC